MSLETRTDTTVPEKKGEIEALASTVKDRDSSNPAPTVTVIWELLMCSLFIFESEPHSLHFIHHV